jgi:hypothetical protein
MSGTDMVVRKLYHRRSSLNTIAYIGTEPCLDNTYPVEWSVQHEDNGFKRGWKSVEE